MYLGRREACKERRGEAISQQNGILACSFIRDLKRRTQDSMVYFHYPHA